MLKPNMVHCDKCTNLFPEVLDNISQYVRYNSKNYCPSCAKELLDICYGCGELLETSYGYYADGNIYHGSCFTEQYFDCDGCNGTFCRDETEERYHEDSDSLYCSECFHDLNFNNASYFSTTSLNLNNTTFKHLRNKRCFGIELEIDANNLPYKDIRSLNCFGSKYDGSLKKGSEFYSPILQGDKGYDAIKTLCSMVGKVDVSSHAGYHLHLDGRNLRYKEVQKIWLLYRIFEGTLLAMLPDSRQVNGYCRQSCIHIDEIYSCDYGELENLWYSQTNDDYDRYEQHHETRYLGFNLHSYFYQNTIEIRYHSGTVNFEKIINWIKINQAITTYALNHTLDEIYQLKNLEQYTTNYSKIRKLFKSVIGSNLLWQYYKKRFGKFSGGSYELGWYTKNKDFQNSNVVSETPEPICSLV